MTVKTCACIWSHAWKKVYSHWCRENYRIPSCSGGGDVRGQGKTFSSAGRVHIYHLYK